MPFKSVAALTVTPLPETISIPTEMSVCPLAYAVRAFVSSVFTKKCTESGARRLCASMRMRLFSSVVTVTVTGALRAVAVNFSLVAPDSVKRSFPLRFVSGGTGQCMSKALFPNVNSPLTRVFLLPVSGIASFRFKDASPAAFAPLKAPPSMAPTGLAVRYWLIVARGAVASAEIVRSVSLTPMCAI